MMWCHSLQVREALHRLLASSSPKIFTLISVGRVSAKFSGAAAPPAGLREALLLEAGNTGDVLVDSCCIVAREPGGSRRPGGINEGFNVPGCDVADYIRSFTSGEEDVSKRGTICSEGFCSSFVLCCILDSLQGKKCCRRSKLAVLASVAKTNSQVYSLLVLDYKRHHNQKPLPRPINDTQTLTPH